MAKANCSAATLFCPDVTEINKKSATADDHRSLDIAFDTETAIAVSVERRFLHFTSLNPQFLEQVEAFREHLTLERITAPPNLEPGCLTRS
jgi:hypothetical protein